MVKFAREKSVLVRDVMATDLLLVTVGTPLPEAAAMLAEWRISGAPVVSRSGKPIGIVSRGDILDPRHQGVAHAVEDVMTRVLYAVRPGDTLVSAARLMTAEHIHRVLVADEDGRLVGLVSAMDVVRVVAESESHDAPLEYVQLGSST